MTKAEKSAGASRKLAPLAVVLLTVPWLGALAVPESISPAALAIIKGAIEANAGSGPDQLATVPFQSPAVTGEVRLGGAADRAGRRCRGLSVSETEPGGIRRRYVGDVCLSSGVWTLERLTPAPTAVQVGGAVVAGVLAAAPKNFGAAAKKATKPSLDEKASLAPPKAQPPPPPPLPAPAPAPPQEPEPPPPPPPAPVVTGGKPALPTAAAPGHGPAASAQGPPPLGAEAGSASADGVRGGAAAPGPAASGPIGKEQAQLAAQLQSVLLRYNKPDVLSADSETLIALIAEVQGAASGKDALQGLPGQQIEKPVLLSPVVTAHLSGDPQAVEIMPRMAETQPVTPVNNVQWLWSVKAKRPGHTTLTLEVTANVMLDGKASVVQVHTYTDRFAVKIGWLSWIKYEIDQINPIWKWLGLGTPVAIIAGLWALLRNRRPKN